MIKLRNKFPDVPGLDVELISLVKQIESMFVKTDDPRLNTEYGVLYTHTPIVTTVLADAYHKLTGLSTHLLNGVSVIDSSFRIKTTGRYSIGVSSSFTNSVNNTEVHYSIFVNDIEDTTTEAERKVGTASDLGNAGITGIIDLKAGDIVDFRYNANKSSDITTNHCNMNIVKL